MLRPPRPRGPVPSAALSRCPECGEDAATRTYPREVAGRTVTMLDARCSACTWRYVRVQPPGAR